MFMMAVYVNLGDGTYNIIKQDKDLKKYMPDDSDYIADIPAFIKKYAASEYCDAVMKFVSYDHMRNQINDVDTVTFDNVNGCKCLLNMVADKDNNGCVIMLQEIKL